MDWNAALYDQRHSFVWKGGEDLIALLDPKPGERILDVGCGTGRLTAMLAASGALVTGLDPSSAMLEQARIACAGVTFVEASLLDFSPVEPFDAVFSNAALHWIMPGAEAARRMGAALKPGGRLVAELGGAGNVATLVQAAHEALAELGQAAETPWYFPGIAEYAGLLESAGLEVVYALLFDRPTPLEGGAEGLGNWLSVFAPRWKAAILDRLDDKVRPKLYDPAAGQWRMDYRRLRIAARKPA